MHRLTHAGTKPYLCKYDDGAGDPCPSAFTRKHDLQRHVDSVHLMATKFKCSHCGVECKRQDGFRRHQLSNPQCRMANNVAQVLRRRDETTAEAELREEAEGMYELESSEEDESNSEEDVFASSCTFRTARIRPLLKLSVYAMRTYKVLARTLVGRGQLYLLAHASCGDMIT
ncbi:hypothetical protein BGZ70_008715 [Mortierella alpina]|uniref:C2H2-type domain-containing protein n=1 Tax=Mortierella alpina TaxID=64518 RepID=A0A9P6JGQ0_MORAP|nr:hypothetical protein BGZ70_008715 [Mortierella alpina]